MRIVCQKTILMKYHTLYLLFMRNSQNLKLSSAANYRWRFMGYPQCLEPEFKQKYKSNQKWLATLLFLNMVKIKMQQLKEIVCSLKIGTF